MKKKYLSSLKKQHIPNDIIILCILFYGQQFDSSMLTTSEINILLKLVNDKKNNKKSLGYYWKLLYRATRDGWSTNNFHKKIDTYSNTILLVHTEHNNIFGGFTSLTWNKKYGWQSDKKAFLILIRSSKNYELQIWNVINTTYTVDMTTQRIFRFGMGNSIDIRHDCNNNQRSDVHSVQGSSSTFGIPTAHYLNGDIKRFRVKEIEVFTNQTE